LPKEGRQIWIGRSERLKIGSEHVGEFATECSRQTIKRVDGGIGVVALVARDRGDIDARLLCEPRLRPSARRAKATNAACGKAVVWHRGHSAKLPDGGAMAAVRAESTLHHFGERDTLQRVEKGELNERDDCPRRLNGAIHARTNVGE